VVATVDESVSADTGKDYCDTRHTTGDGWQHCSHTKYRKSKMAAQFRLIGKIQKKRKGWMLL